jgi:competence ComEA-like helix-hairpin-helix protein
MSYNVKDSKALLLLVIIFSIVYILRYQIDLEALFSSPPQAKYNTTLNIKHGEGLLVMGLPIDINSATAQDLSALPGIGPKISKRIVETRERLGGFDSVDDLKMVKGIGNKKLDTIREYVRIK